MESRVSYQPKVYRKQGGNEQVVATGGLLTIESDYGLNNPNVVRSVRQRFTIAQVNAGATILAAVAGYKYRMVDVVGIAVGGAAGAVTTVDVLGTQSASGVKLAAFAQASMTRSTVLRPGVSGTTVLADGASHAPCDANTAITIGKTGSDVTTATHVDVILSYTIEAA